MSASVAIQSRGCFAANYHCDEPGRVQCLCCHPAHFLAAKTACEHERDGENVAQCQEELQTKLFRPPYGKLKWGQARQLKKQYKILMWDVIAGDFDPTIDGATCWNNILQHTTNGSIIVLHDSKKAWDRLQYVLPILLEHYTRLGFKFEAVSADSGIGT